MLALIDMKNTTATQCNYKTTQHMYVGLLDFVLFKIEFILFGSLLTVS